MSITISAKAAMSIIQSMIIAKDDEHYPLWNTSIEGEDMPQLAAFAELWNTLTDEQKVECENGLSDCYRDKQSVRDPGALQQLKVFAATGKDLRERG